MFCLTETKTNEKIGNINEALIKQKEHLFESLKYPWIKHDVCKLRALILYSLIKQNFQYSVLQCLVKV